MAEDYKLLIGGRWRSSKEKREVRNPYNGEVVGVVSQASDQDLEDAILQAQKAFEETRWMAPYQRVEILEKIVQGIKDRRNQLTETITKEAGKPIRFSQGEVERAIYTFSIAVEEAKRIGGEVIPLDVLESSKGRFSFTRRYPIGPIAGITPFNFPLNLVSHKLAPCIASGNTMILKPASQTPITSLLLGEVVMEAGLPPGALNVVPCPGARAERLITDHRIKLITFTGSAEVGWHLKDIAGKKRVLLELGGNAGAIVHSDADLDFAAERLALGAFLYAGQVCISVQRIFAHKDIFEEFSHKFLKAVKRIKVGDPMDPETVVGPMIDLQAAERAEEWVKEAVQGGAEVLAGGQREGVMFQPTVLTNTTPQMRVNCREVFAPVVTLEPYDDFQEAVRAVDDSVYGLQAGVFTNDVRRIFYALDRIQVGGVIINDYPTYRIDHMPYGGVKDSGFGREGIKYAIEEMTELKLLVLNLS